MNGADGYRYAPRGRRTDDGEAAPLVLVGGESWSSLTFAARCYGVSVSIIAEAWNDRVPVAAVLAARRRREGRA